MEGEDRRLHAQAHRKKQLASMFLSIYASVMCLSMGIYYVYTFFLYTTCGMAKVDSGEWVGGTPIGCQVFVKYL